MKWIQQRAMKMKDWEHLSHKQSLRELGLLSLGMEGSEGILSVCINMWLGEVGREKENQQQTFLSDAQWKDKRQSVTD